MTDSAPLFPALESKKDFSVASFPYVLRKHLLVVLRGNASKKNPLGSTEKEMARSIRCLVHQLALWEHGFLSDIASAAKARGESNCNVEEIIKGETLDRYAFVAAVIRTANENTRLEAMTGYIVSVQSLSENKKGTEPVCPDTLAKKEIGILEKAIRAVAPAAILSRTFVQERLCAQRHASSPQRSAPKNTP